VIAERTRLPLFALLFLFLSWISLGSPAHVRAADHSYPAFQSTQPDQSNRQQEVFLSFNYRNLFEKVVIAYYEDGKYYLPVSEIFSSIKIAHEVDNSSLTISGFYLDPENNFQFDFRNHMVTLENKGTFTIAPSRMMVKEVDYYIEMDVLAEIFDLNFSVDLNNLLLQLQTPNTLPIVAEQERARRRKQQQKASVQQEYYPLVYGRDRAILGGGFLDYSFSSNISQYENSYTYNFDLGTEVAGGDLQGSSFGSYTNGFSSFTTNNLRWRYVMRNNNYLTQIYAGQTRSDGLISRNFTGVRLTNEPIERRYMYDSYEIEGTAPIGSEVELYYNNALYDYTRITEDQQYRFLAPLTYGMSRLKLRIYGPDGRIREREERIQIPFSFLPKGEFSYHLNAGRLDNAIVGTPSTSDSYLTQGDVSYGVSNWLTQKAGVEYFNQFSDQTPLFYTSSSARIFDDYLLNLDVAPSTFYRISGNVIYPSSASWGVNYTYYSDSGVYNPIGYDQEFSANAFVPFKIAELPLNLRVTGNYAERPNQNNINYSVDLNSRINRLNIRLSYQDRRFDSFSLSPSASSELRASATYLLSRRPNIPRYLQNTFISGTLNYSPGLGQFREAELQASRSIFEQGRLQASYARNFAGRFNYINLGLTIDFNSFRSTSTARNIRSQSSFTQNIRGSIGFDDYNKDFVFSNREQVGRAATSLRLYVDSNNSGSYDEGDDIIQEEAVRIGRAGSKSSSDEGVLRFSQLQQYYRINMEINQAAIKNPMLVPKLEKFSIITDPNQYKPINIPFYTSGVISGKVVKSVNGQTSPQSGLRIYLKSKPDSTSDESFSKEMRTFSDGAFYSYEIPPGSYNLYVDRKQLEFLDMTSEPDTMSVEVEALAEGDFVEGLNFTLHPRQPIKPQADTTKVVQKDTVSQKQEPQGPFYQIQLASFKTLPKAHGVAEGATRQLGNPYTTILNTNTSLYAIRSGPINDKSVAFKKIASIIDGKYSGAGLVILKDTTLQRDAVTQSDVIQLASFQNIEAARAYSRQAESRLKKKTGLTYDSDTGKYAVYLNEKLREDESLQSQLQTIRRDSLFSEAEINENLQTPLFIGSESRRAMNFTFQIRIQDLGKDVTDELLQSLVANEAEVTISRPSSDTVLYKGLTSWTKTMRLYQKLKTIPAGSRPIVILVEQ